VRDRHRLKDRVSGVCLISSAVALLLADVISPVMSSSNAHQLEIVGRQGPRQFVSAVLALLALALLIPAGLGLAGKLRERWGSHGITGAALLVAGVLATTLSLSLALVEWQASRGGLDRAQMTSLLDQLMSNTGIAVLFALGAGVPLGLAVLALGLVRDRVLAAPLAALLVAGPTVVDAGFALNSLPTAIAGSAVMTVGFLLVARALFLGEAAARRSVLSQRAYGA
jgi:hypothetical protein